MATKVKGDKIKEGSIPLSALATEVKDKIENAGGGADWNVKEGEVGYIKNRPFYAEGDIRQIDVNGEYTISVGEFNVGDKVDVSWDLDYYGGEVFRGSTSFIIREEWTTYYYKDNFVIEGGKYVEMYAYGGGDSHYGKVTVIVNGEIKTLDDKYIPDTVLKTTPQTLSDTDKNQALANLGIDPVVWKYMCNPFIIKIEGEECYVPEELVDLDSLFDSGDYGRVYTWKYLIPAMYVGYDDMDAKYFAVTYGEPNHDVPTLGFNDASIYINEEFKVVY